MDMQVDAPNAESLLASLRDAVPAMQGRAVALDQQEAFPAEDVAFLRGIGALRAPLPRTAGGLGAGTSAEGATTLLAILGLLGQGNPAVGRVYEAHVNAVALVAQYGTPAQLDAAGQHLFGLWVTDAPDDPLRLVDGVLRGSKAPCSGAGHAARALVTVETGEGTRMAIVDPGAAEVAPMRGLLHGMRAAVNGSVRFDGIRLPRDALVGAPGDYLREPDFSGGAWRTMAVTAGLLDALVAEARRQLVRRGHHTAVPQQERFGRAWIAAQSAALWTARAAEAAEHDAMPMGDRIATVNLARIAVESACLDAMQLVQRSLGLGAFLRSNPMERMARDLATYLRQPAPDAVLTEAAAYWLDQA